MKLYGADVCPFVHRVRLALHEKNLEFEYVHVDLRNKPEWYYDVLPSGRVPLLEDGDARLYESSVICEYLEDAYPQPSLWPARPARRGQARLWISWYNDQLIPAFYKLLTRSEGAKELEEMLQKLESEAFPGDWVVGEGPTLADLELYPWVERWCVLSHYRGFEFPPGKLNDWRRRMEARPSVAATRQPESFYIEEYQDYAERSKSIATA